MARFQLVSGNLFCKGNDVQATGQLEGHYVLVVFAGSTAVGNRLFNQRLLDQGVIRHDGKLFHFDKDFPFPNPTTASDYVLGNPDTDGWKSWKNQAGQTLRELVKAAGYEWLISKT